MGKKCPLLPDSLQSQRLGHLLANVVITCELTVIKQPQTSIFPYKRPMFTYCSYKRQDFFPPRRKPCKYGRVNTGWRTARFHLPLRGRIQPKGDMMVNPQTSKPPRPGPVHWDFMHQVAPWKHSVTAYQVIISARLLYESESLGDIQIREVFLKLLIADGENGCINH